MKKFIIAVLLCLFSTFASATYRVEINDPVAEEAYAFESCEVMFLSIYPGDNEGTYVSVNCDDDPVTINWNSNPPNPNAKIEEFYVKYNITGELEKYDCYVELFIHESSEPGVINVTCGQYANFTSGFEIGIASKR